MILDRRVLAGAMGIALFVAACGGSSASPAASAAPAASQAAESPAAATPATPAATDGASSPGSSFEPSFTTGAAADLEAMLPDKAGTTTYTKTSFDGASLGVAGLGIDSGSLDPILQANGKTIADVRVAMATPATPSATDMSQIVAFQVKGLDASKLLPLFAPTDSGTTMTPTTISGKQVLQAAAPGFSSVAYVKGDVLFLVILASAAQVQEIVAALP